MAGHLVLQSLQRRYVYVPETETVAAKEKAQKVVTSNTHNTNKNTTTSLMYKLLKPLPPLTKNTFLLSFLAGGALGSFVLSSTAGKNIVHLLHPIFNVGSRQQQASQERGHYTSRLEQDDDDQLDIQHHKQRSLHRKSSIKERLETGHSLSDTHSTFAHSPLNEEEVKSRALHRAQRWERRQTERRRWVKDRIESGGGLSDSHVTGGGGSGK